MLKCLWLHVLTLRWLQVPKRNSWVALVLVRRTLRNSTMVTTMLDILMNVIWSCETVRCQGPSRSNPPRVRELKPMGHTLWIFVAQCYAIRLEDGHKYQVAIKSCTCVRMGVDALRYCTNAISESTPGNLTYNIQCFVNVILVVGTIVASRPVDVPSGKLT